MTLKQIEKIRDGLSKLKLFRCAPEAQTIVHLDEELQNFFGKAYASPSLSSWHHLYNGIDITEQDMLYDIDNIVAVLEGMLAVVPGAVEANNILDLIREGEGLSDDNSERQKFIAKVFYSYGEVIKFDKSIENLAKHSIAYKSSWDFLSEETKYEVAVEVIQGILHKLRVYAEDILKGKKQTTKQQKEAPSVVINNSPTAVATAQAENTTTIDISIIFENARQQAEDEGLADEQYKAVMDKLAELENISKSKESKGKRWAKAKEIMKWLVEQGIQVAGILLPVLAQTIK